jgi:ABC-type protease/lipase transport system fused ATPase/permease subunit
LNLLFLASPIYLMQIFDRVLGSGRIETLIALTAIVAAAMLFMGVLDSVRAMMLNRAGRWLERRMAPDLIAASMRLTLEGYPSTAQPPRPNHDQEFRG